MTDQILRDAMERALSTGMSVNDAAACFGLDGAEGARVLQGKVLAPLRERHAISNWLGFTRRAAAWNNRTDK